MLELSGARGVRLEWIGKHPYSSGQRVNSFGWVNFTYRIR